MGKKIISAVSSTKKKAANKPAARNPINLFCRPEAIHPHSEKKEISF
jgi:hypothetical protein